MSDTVLAWHFLREDRCLQYPPRTLVRAGRRLTHDGPLVMCVSGLHASVRALDALKYAPGPVLCRVECGGDVEWKADKLVCRERRVLWLRDATRMLHEFSCDVVTRALERERSSGREPDARSWGAIAAKRRWLQHEISDAALAAASDAAKDAANDAAKDAAGGLAGFVASDVAWAAARSAASAAAWSVASDVAWAAARSAARDAEIKWQTDEFEKRCLELEGGAENE